jgi:hypothetical protein
MAIHTGMSGRWPRLRPSFRHVFLNSQAGTLDFAAGGSAGDSTGVAFVSTGVVAGVASSAGLDSCASMRRRSRWERSRRRGGLRATKRVSLSGAGSRCGLVGSAQDDRVRRGRAGSSLVVVGRGGRFGRSGVSGRRGYGAHFPGGLRDGRDGASSRGLAGFRGLLVSSWTRKAGNHGHAKF